MLVGACQAPLSSADLPTDKQATRLSPALQRIRAAYQDLESGRFVVLADFNSPPQALLARTVGPDGQEGQRPQPAISVLRSRDETGAGGLMAHLSSSSDRLLLDGVRSAELALPRDWDGYHLLLASLFGPPDGLTLELTLQSGDPPGLSWSRRVRLQPGWNLLRIDLFEPAGQIDLRDVRALAWRAPELSVGVDLFLDDLILADNTRWLMGETAGPGELYAFGQGRRIHVGARDRFELAFSDGVIVQWLAADNEKLNLTLPTGLGPWPAPLPDDWAFRRSDPIVYDDPELYRHWGAGAGARQRLTELTPFRAVLTGTWAFPSTSPGGASRSAAGHTWTYAVYPSGQVYVRVLSQAPDSGWNTPRVGYAVAVNASPAFQAITPERAGTTNGIFALLSLPGTDRPDLLWAPYAPALAQRRVLLTSADGRRMAITLGDTEAVNRVESAHLLRFWPYDLDAAPEAAAFAADYQQPARLVVTRGRVVRDQMGDLDADGFNESEGCYELALADGLLRFTIDPAGLLRPHPAFRVHGTAGLECWVYADGRIITPLAQDAAGELMFELPRTIREPVTIELATRAKSASAPAGKLP